MNWNKLVRVNGWVSRFNSRSTKDQRKRDSLNIDELQESEKGIIINAQKQSFFEEYEKLAKGKALPNSSKILALKPQLDKYGLLRSCGRLQSVNYLSYDIRYPIILPRGHIVTKLIIKQHHEDKHHAIGTNQLLAKLSVRFWILSVREVIREVEKNCNECKKRKAKLAKQIMAPLAALRFKESLRAFTKIGLYFAGPFINKQGNALKIPVFIYVPSLSSYTFGDSIWYGHKFIPHGILQNGESKRITT